MTVDFAEPLVKDNSAWLNAIKGENLIAEACRNQAAVEALADYAFSLKNIARFDDDKDVARSARNLSGKLTR